MRMELWKNPLNMRIVDLRLLSYEKRREAWITWLRRNIPCRYGGSHSWMTHRWEPEFRVWHWGPCLRCGVYRVVQTTGNYIAWHQEENYLDALAVNDEFEDLEGRLNHFLAKHTWLRTNPLWLEKQVKT